MRASLALLTLLLALIQPSNGFFSSPPSYCRRRQAGFDRGAARLVRAAAAPAAPASTVDDKKPVAKPRSACFSSGPTRKRPGYSLASLPTQSLGRSHRAAACLGRIQLAIQHTKVDQFKSLRKENASNRPWSVR